MLAAKSLSCVVVVTARSLPVFAPVALAGDDDEPQAHR